MQVQPDPAIGAGAIVVTNDKGIGARGPVSTITYKGPTPPATGHNTYDDTGSVTTFTMPRDDQIPRDTRSVFTNDDWNQIRPINQGDYDTVPKVIPARLGGSSPIEHVVVIVKENRTYDQILGDLGEGNGDPTLAQFGGQATPNLHALAKRYGDLDNFYDEGTLSADGHNWLVQAEANDYVEKEFGAFYRSYPSQGGDSLAYQRDGFLWNAAEKSGLERPELRRVHPRPVRPGGECARVESVVRRVAVAGERATGPRADQQPMSVGAGEGGHTVAPADHRAVLPELPALYPGSVSGR